MTVINSFPGYEFVDGKNMFRGIDVGKGGYVYSEPGMYGNVALLDVASMHPNSAINLNAFGEYTSRFKELVDARIAIKNKDFDKARKMFNGKLEPFLKDEQTAKSLAQALKIAINSVYGLTSANFENPFRDVRNVNNIIALRGALFMKTLQDEVQKRGFKVAHVKTDSIKIPDATPEIIEFVMEFAKQYGYEFEHEATYERMCLVNDAVYIAKYPNGEWTATGTQFQIPYVFKKLFSKEEITFDDLCETKSVTSSLYLDMNEEILDVLGEDNLIDLEKKLAKAIKNNESEEVIENLQEEISKFHNYIFVGKVGRFCPIKEGRGGGLLCREKDGKFYSATGAKGYRWLESETVLENNLQDAIDEKHFIEMADDAIETISKFGDFEWFVSDDEYVEPEYAIGEYGRYPIYK